ncbi:MAG: TetR/AcrR family transcriptional regulator [Marmoricola sp.]
MAPHERPRVEGEREDEILEATVDLLVEVGYDRLTMDAVARQAHASKATLYRRWESKPELVIESLMRAKDMPEPHDPDTGSLRGDLMAAFCGNTGLASPRTSGVMGAVITAVTTDEDFAEAFREQFIAPKLAISQGIYARALARGEVAEDADLEIIAPALAGVCLHRMYVMGSPPDDRTIERVIDHLILPAVLAPARNASKPTPGGNTRA